MTMLARIARLFRAVAFGIAASATAGPGTEGTVNGWLEVKGERLAHTHVFAAAETDRLEGCWARIVLPTNVSEERKESQSRSCGSGSRWRASLSGDSPWPRT